MSNIDHPEGLRRAEVQLETAAFRFASAGAISRNGSNLDVIDLSAEKWR